MPHINCPGFYGYAPSWNISVTKMLVISTAREVSIRKEQSVGRSGRALERGKRARDISISYSSSHHREDSWLYTQKPLAWLTILQYVIPEIEPCRMKCKCPTQCTIASAPPFYMREILDIQPQNASVLWLCKA